MPPLAQKSLEGALTGPPVPGPSCADYCCHPTENTAENNGCSCGEGGADVSRTSSEEFHLTAAHWANENRAKKNHAARRPRKQRGKKSLHPHGPEVRSAKGHERARGVERLTGAAECRKHWTTALIPRSSGQGTHPSKRGASSSGLKRRQMQNQPASPCKGKQGRSKTGNRIYSPMSGLAPMSAPGGTGERQETPGVAILAFAGAGTEKEGHLRILDIPRSQVWAAGRCFQKNVPFLYAAHVS